MARRFWRSDGTTTGTVVLKHPQPLSNYVTTSLLTTFLGNVYFAANDEAVGRELWKSNGTTIGTALFKDINTDYVGSNPAKLQEVNGKLFFSRPIFSAADTSCGSPTELRWVRSW